MLITYGDAHAYTHTHKENRNQQTSLFYWLPRLAVRWKSPLSKEPFQLLGLMSRKNTPMAWNDDNDESVQNWQSLISFCDFFYVVWTLRPWHPADDRSTVRWVWNSRTSNHGCLEPWQILANLGNRTWTWGAGQLVVPICFATDSDPSHQTSNVVIIWTPKSGSGWMFNVNGFNRLVVLLVISLGRPG